jgi:hypothetical protein
MGVRSGRAMVIRVWFNRKTLGKQQVARFIFDLRQTNVHMPTDKSSPGTAEEPFRAKEEPDGLLSGYCML